ncbi:MAG: phosphatase PAP2 family protein [Desulfovibrio sp.]|uniref:phosphatase PAP2 family protein n=1 Tax=Desulfovibrio sp. 7SRBS1 TaxID=3378064 RepID=UPI003B40B6FA
MLLMLGTVLAVCGPDTQSFFFFREHRYLHPGFHTCMSIISAWGAPAIYVWYAVILVRSLRIKELGARQAGKRFIARFLVVQLAICALLVRAVKIFIGKARPDVGRGTALFQPFSLDGGHNSFPSGHTAEITGCVLPLALRYRSPLLSLGLGLVAALVAFTRIYLAKHFPSDVFFGWLIGSLSGLIIYIWAGPEIHPQPDRIA